MPVWSTAGQRPGAFFGRRRRPRKKYGVLRMLLGTMATLCAMWVLTTTLLDPPEFAVQAANKPAAPRHEWVEIVKPFQLYTLPSAAFGAEPRHFSARRHTASQGRTDALTFGAEEPGKGNWLRIEIHRFGKAAEAEVPLYPELARQAARAGHSIARSGLPDLAETRFGAAEMADLQIAAGERFTACIGFRISRHGPGFGLAGIACGTPARPLDRRTLTCVIDRLDLIAAGEDREIGNYFATRELFRMRECPAARILSSLDRPDWLNPAEARAPLKGSLTLAAAKAQH